MGLKRGYLASTPPGSRRLKISTTVTLDLSTIVDISDNDTVVQITNRAHDALTEQMQQMLDRKQFRVSDTDIDYQEFE
jgi:hypothetical protein